MKLLKLVRNLLCRCPGEHWDIESRLKMTNEQAASYHLDMYESLRGKH